MSVELLSEIESLIKTYIQSLFPDDNFVTVSVGYPNFEKHLPLSKVNITVTRNDSRNIASGYDNIVLSETSEDIHFEERSELERHSLDIDFWASRGDVKNPSPSGGRSGAQRYASAVHKAFTVESYLFYSKHSEIDIDEYFTGYTFIPANFDKADLFQVHAELTLTRVI